MTMNLSEDDKRRLKAVVRAGRFSSEEEALSAAIRMLEPDATAGRAGELLPPDQWREEFRRVTEGFSGGNPNADYSRDSIYGDDGR